MYRPGGAVCINLQLFGAAWMLFVPGCDVSSRRTNALLKGVASQSLSCCCCCCVRHCCSWCCCCVCNVCVLQGAYDRARSILTRNESELHALAGELLEKETLGGDQIRVIMKQVSDMALHAVSTLLFCTFGFNSTFELNFGTSKPNCATLYESAVPQPNAGF